MTLTKRKESGIVTILNEEAQNFVSTLNFGNTVFYFTAN